MGTAWVEGSESMTYEQLEVNTEISLKEKSEDGRNSRKIQYTIVSKYPHMCIVEDRKGRRRGVAVGELIMNKVITQNTYLEALRGELRTCNKKRGWHKKETKQEAVYAQ